MLSILRTGMGVGRAIRRLHNDVGRATVSGRIVKFEREFETAHHFIDEERYGIRVQVVGHLLVGDVLAL